jgi:6-O-methylguanine DNA methyltransferase, DNA binding domain
MATRKSWREKLDNPDLPKVVAMPDRLRKRLGNGTMLIPHPREIEACIRAVRRGRLTTVSQIRRTLSEKHGTDVTCPLVTGISVRIAAEAAEEEAAAGKTRITPYWRVVGDNGSLNPKFPGGLDRQEQRLRDEGHRIVLGGKKRIPRVAPQLHSR